MNGRAKRFLIFGLLIVALGAGGYAVARLAIAQIDDDSGPDYLRARSRSQLSLCVEGAGGYAVPEEDVQAVREALDDALGNFPNVPPEYLDDSEIAAPEVPAQYLQRQVVSGCPAARALTATPSNPFDWSFDFGVAVSGSEAASEHRVFVFLVEPDAYAASFASAPYAATVEEFLCGSDVCEGVTRGLYLSVPPDGDALREGLLRALNLLKRRSSEMEPDIDWAAIDWAACERGEQPHPRYTCEFLEDWGHDLCARQEEEGPVPPGLDCDRWYGR